MTSKKIFRLIHLWLGLISGVIMFIVCLTGAIWVFNKEITGWMEGDQKLPVYEEGAKLLPPSKLVEFAKEELKGQKASYVSYSRNEPAQVGAYGGKKRVSVTIDPYSGKVLKSQSSSFNEGKKFDFFRFIMNGHRTLWLPREIGRPIVNYGTLLFVITLISGIVLWVPKDKKMARNRLWFHWKKNTGIRRKFYDIHTVTGFYFSFFLITIAMTGMVWGLDWYSKGLYKLTTGGKDLPDWNVSLSDTMNVNTGIDPDQAVDKIFYKLLTENPRAYGLQISYPDLKDAGSVIGASVYPEAGVFYNRDGYYFDRYTLKEISADGPYNGRYSNAEFGDKLRRMNYDIHVGAIGGLPGKFLAFFSALFGASLPVTGVYLWLKKRKKHKPVP